MIKLPITINTKGFHIAILSLASIMFADAQQPVGYFLKEFTQPSGN